MKKDNIKIVRSALEYGRNELWDEWHSSMSEDQFKDHPLIQDIDASLTALNSLVDAAALIEWLEGQKKVNNTGKKQQPMLGQYGDIRIETHNAQIEETLKYLRGEFYE